MFKFPEILNHFHNNFPLLPGRLRVEKVENLVTNLHDTTECVIKNSKQALNHTLFLKKYHTVIIFNQKFRLKPYIHMNTKLRKKTKNDFEKGFLKLMNNAAFGKTLENKRKLRNIILARTEMRRNCLVSEPNYHTTKFFIDNLLAIEMRKIQLLINTPVSLGSSILDMINTVIYEFWYVELKNGEKSETSYIDTNSFIACIKADDNYKQIAEDAEKNYERSCWIKRKNLHLLIK